MELLELFNIQGTLFLMILVGALVKKLGIVDEAGRRCLTDLCVNVIIPCNILKSCLIDLDSSVLSACEILVVVALAIQIISVILNKFLYKNYPEAQNKVLKYCTLVSNGGFLGNGVAEGVYGTLGLLYASMYLIPMRIVMWSAGTSYFVAGGTDKKKVVRNILTHPCLVAVYIPCPPCSPPPLQASATAIPPLPCLSLAPFWWMCLCLPSSTQPHCGSAPCVWCCCPQRPGGSPWLWGLSRWPPAWL